MKLFAAFIFSCWVSLLLSFSALASSILDINLSDRIEPSEAIALVEFLANEPFRNPADGRIYTRTYLKTEEALKGTFPEVINVVHRGGMVDGAGEINGFSPSFSTGSYLVFLTVNAQGNLQAVNGAASVFSVGGPQRGFVEEVRTTLQNNPQLGLDLSAFASVGPKVSERTIKVQVLQSSVTGLIVDDGIASRFLTADRGEPIPYLVDADELPGRMTQQQALTALENALEAWAEVTSLTFRFEGIESFGTGADLLELDDEKLHIQLHDIYDRIPGATTLGIGGASVLPGPSDVWGFGGNVSGNEFHKSSGGFVILKHSNSSMEDPVTFEEVLCHEIGHALSMAHTSTNPEETDPLLRESIMFYQAHKDGRGATLGGDDVTTILQAYPVESTPPYTFDRRLDVIHSPQTPTAPGVNEIKLQGYSLNDSTLTVELGEVVDNNNGTFSLIGDLLTFTPVGYVGEQDLIASGNFSWARASARFSDGTNASPPLQIRITKILEDTFPSGNVDGIPNSWMIEYFGDANPAAGANRGANDDFDSDGFTNRQEYNLGSDPTVADTGNPDANLALEVTSGDSISWSAQPFGLYEIQRTSDFGDWELFRAVSVDSESASVTLYQNELTGKDFFRILKVQ